MSADLVTHDKQEEDGNLETQRLAIDSYDCCDMTRSCFRKGCERHTLMYEAMNVRTSNGVVKNESTPLNISMIMQATMP
jgi:hypothetical protein